MFQEATSFNQDISSWCVINIASEPTDFSTDSPLSETNKPVWGTCPTASVDDQNQLDISIYPNPSLDIVYIDGNYSQLKAVVYDILGKQVINKSITNSIDISQLEKGVYILQLSDGAKLTTTKNYKEVNKTYFKTQPLQKCRGFLLRYFYIFKISLSILSEKIFHYVRMYRT